MVKKMYIKLSKKYRLNVKKAAFALLVAFNVVGSVWALAMYIQWIQQYNAALETLMNTF